MKIIGLAGGSGSGKGTVSKIFLTLGIPSIDADAVYHNITSHKSPCLDALVLEFSPDILNLDGGLDRGKLSQIVFNSDNAEIKHKKLNEISHKFVLSEIRAMISKYEKRGFDTVIVDAPLLFESGFNKECDVIISVFAPIETRIERIISRDRIDRARALSRINSQIPDDTLRENSDYSICNDGDLEMLEKEIKKIYKLIKE